MNSGVNNRLPTPLKKNWKGVMHDIDHVDMSKFWQSLAFLLSYFTCKNPKDGDMYVGKETNIASFSSHEG